MLTIVDTYTATLVAGTATVTTSDVQAGDSFVICIQDLLWNNRIGVGKSSMYHVPQASITANISFDVNAANNVSGVLNPQDLSVLTIFQYR